MPMACKSSLACCKAFQKHAWTNPLGILWFRGRKSRIKTYLDGWSIICQNAVTSCLHWLGHPSLTMFWVTFLPSLPGWFLWSLSFCQSPNYTIGRATKVTTNKAQARPHNKHFLGNMTDWSQRPELGLGWDRLPCPSDTHGLVSFVGLLLEERGGSVPVSFTPRCCGFFPCWNWPKHLVFHLIINQEASNFRPR